MADNEKKKKSGVPSPLQGIGGNGAVTTHIELTEAGRKFLKQDVDSAYDAVKDNPTAENFAEALKQKFANNKWSEDAAGLKQHVGEWGKVAAVDSAVAKASVNGMITPDKLQSIADDIERQTTGLVNQMQATGPMAQTSPAPQRDLQQSHADLNSFLQNGFSSDPQLRKFQEGFVKELGGIDNLRKIAATDPAQLPQEIQENLVEIGNTTFQTKEKVIEVVQQFFGDAAPEVVGTAKGGTLPASLQPDTPGMEPVEHTPSLAMTMAPGGP